MEYLRGVLGIIFFVSIAWIFSQKKSAINWRLILGGIIFQLALGLLIIKIPFVAFAFRKLSAAFVKFLSFADEGTAFLFGNLFENAEGFVVVFKVLPVIIFFATISSGLYYLGILQKLVQAMAWLMRKFMQLSGAESLAVAGNIFLGQTESPLMIKPFIAKMTRSEIMCLMTGGMATIAGGVLAGYVAFLGGDDPQERSRFAAYLLSASFMNAPAAIVMAKLMVPEINKEAIQKNFNIRGDDLGVNLLDALSRGALEGLKLALNVGAIVLAFISIIAAINYLLTDIVGFYTGINPIIQNYTNNAYEGLSLEYLLGQIFRIFAFMMGVDWVETLQVGSLLGKKTVVNEFVAYKDLVVMREDGLLNPQSLIIATYALCGFSNFGSIAIQIGGIGGMAPNQQATLSALGLKALLAATLACMMTGTIAGVIVN